MNASLIEQYSRQWKWRNWEYAYSKIPDIKNLLIYDFGCAHRDHKKKLSELGAKVHGFDNNSELLTYAIKRNIKNAKFTEADIKDVHDMALSQVDGIWSSFLPAYFANLKEFLSNWNTKIMRYELFYINSFLLFY